MKTIATGIATTAATAFGGAGLGFRVAGVLALGFAAATAAAAGEVKVSVSRISEARPIESGPGGPDAATLGRLELSAAEAIDATRALVAHDKDSPLWVMDARSGRIVGSALNPAGWPGTTAEGPKWEGLARDDEGWYYVVGSHSGKPGEREQREVFARFRLKVEPGPDGAVAIDPSSVQRAELVGPLLEALRSSGLSAKKIEKRKIEGLAFRKSDAGRELIFGLREPDDRARVFAARIEDGGSADGRFAVGALRPLFDFKPGDSRVAGVPLTLTSIHASDKLGGYLMLTASEDDDNAFHGSALWFAPYDNPGSARKLADLHPDHKPEGLTEIGENADPKTVEILVVYDNDRKKTGIPSDWQRITLSID